MRGKNVNGGKCLKVTYRSQAGLEAAHGSSVINPYTIEKSLIH
jgi:hypothetical protein